MTDFVVDRQDGSFPCGKRDLHVPAFLSQETRTGTRVPTCPGMAVPRGADVPYVLNDMGWLGWDSLLVLGDSSPTFGTT
jgi:hypothetical protein